MKKSFIIAVVFAFVMSISAVAFAAIPKPLDKMAKGVLEVIKSPIELYDHTKKEVNGQDIKAFGLIKGLVTAPFYMVEKAGKGVVDVATFPIK